MRKMKMMRRIIAVIMALIMTMALCACGSSAAPAATSAPAAAATEAPAAADPLASYNGQLRVGMECAYAPSNWQESAATDTNVPVENVPGAYAEGYDVQIARIVADALGLELVIVKMDWDGLIPALNAGQIDCIIAGMMDTAARREAINFSDPYKETIYAMMINKDSAYAGATNIQDFSGASVLGQRDTALDTVIDQINGVNHLTAVASVPDMVARLQQGACDAIVINLESADVYLDTNPNFMVIAFEGDNGFELPAKGSCVGVRKSDDVLLGLVNEALATVDSETRLAMWDTAVENAPA